MRREDGGYELSLYGKGLLTDKAIAFNLKKLQVAFPKQPSSFFDILTERLIANGFTDKRLTDAVNYTIDNFCYKELTVADIISFDKRERLYEHNDVWKLVQKGLYGWDDFEHLKIGSKVFWKLKSK